MSFQDTYTMSDLPDFALIDLANDKSIPYLLIQDFDIELESRSPHFPPEYDSEGNIIISKVIGYENNRPIWS